MFLLDQSPKPPNIPLLGRNSINPKKRDRYFGQHILNGKLKEKHASDLKYKPPAGFFYLVTPVGSLF